jgi:hypothetical protein
MMTPLERITERVSRHGNVNLPETMRPVLTLDEFFQGNDLRGTIGCNLDSQPTASQFFECLENIAARPRVADVRVIVTLFDDPSWPFSDTVCLVTACSPEEVSGWFGNEFQPTECWEGWYDIPTEPLVVSDGFRIITCQWD